MGKIYSKSDQLTLSVVKVFTDFLSLFLTGETGLPRAIGKAFWLGMETFVSQNLNQGRGQEGSDQQQALIYRQRIDGFTDGWKRFFTPFE
jgi:hypothetical protein